MKFKLDSKQMEKLSSWKKEQNNIIKKIEKEMTRSPAAGGYYSYIFTPMSIGLCIQVENNLTKDKIDLTDYDAF